MIVVGLTRFCTLCDCINPSIAVSLIGFPVYCKSLPAHCHFAAAFNAGESHPTIAQRSVGRCSGGEKMKKSSPQYKEHASSSQGPFLAPELRGENNIQSSSSTCTYYILNRLFMTRRPRKTPRYHRHSFTQQNHTNLFQQSTSRLLIPLRSPD